MKQPSLLPAVVPEIDHDLRRLDIPESLPERFPEAVDELIELGQVFCRVFGGIKDPEKLRKAVPVFTDVLAGMRKSGIPVAVAWGAFRQAVCARSGQPLVGHLAKTAFGYLPEGRARYEVNPTRDDCSPPCRVAPNAPPKPRIPNTRAHYADFGDGEPGEWIVEDIR